MIVDKRLVDGVIRVTKKYYRTGDTDYLLALTVAREILGSLSRQVVDLVFNLTRYTQVSGKGTYDDIYKALAVFGIIVENKEKENEN